MPSSKNALIRYKTIDACLRNRFRQWTIDDLVEACSDALYEYEGISGGISKRTVFLDIHNMRSEKLGFNAPIVVRDGKYYEYSDPDYSITNCPLTDTEIGMMAEAVGILRQISGFCDMEGMEDVVEKLSDRLFVVKDSLRPVIVIDSNSRLKGLKHIDSLHGCALRRESARVEYQSFDSDKPDSFIFFCYALKEYDNRWYAFGRKQGSGRILNLALDRIVSVTPDRGTRFEEDASFDVLSWFDDIIGVTKYLDREPVTIGLLVYPDEAPYVLTKPVHDSQKVVERRADGSVVVEIRVRTNYELERVILGFGEHVVVLYPQEVRDRISERIHKADSLYHDALSPSLSR